jgi:hypothetical protein
MNGTMMFHNLFGKPIDARPKERAAPAALRHSNYADQRRRGRHEKILSFQPFAELYLPFQPFHLR